MIYQEDIDKIELEVESELASYNLDRDQMQAVVQAVVDTLVGDPLIDKSTAELAHECLREILEDEKGG